MITNKENLRMIREALTISKIQDAASISDWQGSTQDAAKQILRDAGIKKAEVRRHCTDANQRKRLLSFLSDK